MSGGNSGRLRVEWTPGSDRLTGVCFCGAQRQADDPVEIWRWLLAHPDHYRQDPQAA
ncbi:MULTISPECIES: hypothetical protein [Actinomadura]|uniref:Uncharacterized protein n=1 Tax=Actinomadura miaoliensis TaxID=430685 RepID=A0ABP7WVT5_9ACTN